MLKYHVCCYNVINYYDIVTSYCYKTNNYIITYIYYITELSFELTLIILIDI